MRTLLYRLFASGSRTYEHTRARRENVRERAEQELLEAALAEQTAKLAREDGILARLATRGSGAISDQKSHFMKINYLCTIISKSLNPNISL